MNYFEYRIKRYRAEKKKIDSFGGEVISYKDEGELPRYETLRKFEKGLGFTTHVYFK